MLVAVAEHQHGYLAVKRVGLDVDEQGTWAIRSFEELLGPIGTADPSLLLQPGEATTDLLAGPDVRLGGELPSVADPFDGEDPAGCAAVRTLDHDEVGKVSPRDLGRVVPPAELLGYLDAV